MKQTFARKFQFLIDMIHTTKTVYGSDIDFLTNTVASFEVNHDVRRSMLL